MSYAEVTPFSPPEEIGPDLFVVYGSVKPNPLVAFTRNMAVVRHEGELTLINSVRMDDEGLEALEALGTVRHVLRLGSLHGLDDAFYVDRYDATFRALPGGTTYPQPAIDQPLAENGALPFPDGRLFAFRDIAQPEGVILLKRGPGILLTVDAIQSYATPPHKPHTGPIARILIKLRGFPDETIVGPIWTQMMTDDRRALRKEFERLLEWEFDQLLSAHGTFLPAGAHAAVAAAVEARFGAA
jgi:hypothetical protein